MSWQDTLVAALRILVRDESGAAYTDSTLQSTLATAAAYVNLEIGWKTDYIIDVTVPSIEPDPTLDANFSNLPLLKAACLLNQGKLRSSSIKSGIQGGLGSTILNTNNHSDGFAEILAFDSCDLYEELKNQYKFQDFDANVTAAILSPYVGITAAKEE